MVLTRSKKNELMEEPVKLKPPILPKYLVDYDSDSDDESYNESYNESNEESFENETESNEIENKIYNKDTINFSINKNTLKELLSKMQSKKKLIIEDTDEEIELEIETKELNEIKIELNETEIELNETEIELNEIKLNETEIKLNETEIKETEIEEIKLNENNNEYNNFFNNVDDIISGMFFERIPIEEHQKKFKRLIDLEEVSLMNNELKEIKQLYKNESPSIVNILKMNIPLIEKQKLLEKICLFMNSEPLSEEYNYNLNYLITNIKEYSEELIELEKKIKEASNKSGALESFRYKILKSEMSFSNKILAYSKLQQLESTSVNSDDYPEQERWLNNLLSIPFGKFRGENFDKTPNKIIKNVSDVLNKRISYLDKPKDKIINLIAQNSKLNLRAETQQRIPINSIGLCGVRGVGKTEIVKSISEALDRPYKIIPLGGERDSSLLTGNQSVWLGASWGKLIDVIKQTNCMNPIILFDELDKVDNPSVINALIHITDMTTNSNYCGDKYFTGVEFDFSQILFIFTYNKKTHSNYEMNEVNQILLDRLYKINIEEYSIKEKIEITKKHILPKNLKQTDSDLFFDDDCIQYIVEKCKNNVGMRTVERTIQTIISRINTLLLTNKEDNIVKLDYKKLYDYYSPNFNGKVPKDHVDILLKDSMDESENNILLSMYN